MDRGTRGTRDGGGLDVAGVDRAVCGFYNPKHIGQTLKTVKEGISASHQPRTARFPSGSGTGGAKRMQIIVWATTIRAPVRAPARATKCTRGHSLVGKMGRSPGAHR